MLVYDRSPSARLSTQRLEMNWKGMEFVTTEATKTSDSGLNVSDGWRTESLASLKFASTQSITLTPSHTTYAFH